MADKAKTEGPPAAPANSNDPAPAQALKYIGKPDAPLGGGLPAGDVTADQAHTWYTVGAVWEATEVLKSHKVATKEDAAQIEKAAQPQRRKPKNPNAPAPPAAPEQPQQGGTP